MENKRISVIICSREPHQNKQDFINMVVSTCGAPCDIMFIVNQKNEALSKIYNEYYEKAVNDIVVLIHDDIEFLRDGWGSELINLFAKHQDYGIIGVAGSAQFDAKGAWWNYDKKYGQVLHRNEGKSWLSAFSPLISNDLEEVCVVDGLFIAVDKTRASNEFDVNLQGFDFYDICFCLGNYTKNQTKIGVTTNIRIAHNSIGKLRDSWCISRDYINNKFNNYYPIDVKNRKN